MPNLQTVEIRLAELQEAVLIHAVLLWMDINESDNAVEAVDKILKIKQLIVAAKRANR